MFRLLIGSLTAICLCCSLPAQDSVLSHVSDEIRAGFIVRPASIVRSKVMEELFTVAEDETLLPDMMAEFKSEVGFDPRQIEELAIILDLKTLYAMAEIEVPAAEPGGDEEADMLARLNQQRNRLKQMGLALHNFYDTYRSFPDHDGPEDDNKGNLSWRVHLLPFLEEQKLYEEFKLDEPWDSDHNKALIEKMPSVFRTPGVKEKGKTSLHVMTGKDTIFNGEGAAKFQDITDGTSNTILTVVGGPDKAESWTKPGGIEFRADETPKELLGKIADQFLFGRVDGSVALAPAEMDADELRRMVLINDGEPLTGFGRAADSGPVQLPAILIRGNVALDQTALLTTFRSAGKPEKRVEGDVTYYQYNGYTVCFPSEKLGIAAPTALLPALMKKREKQSAFVKEMTELSAKHDLVFCIDVKGIPDFMAETAGQLPMAGIIQKVHTIRLTSDLSGDGKYLHDVRATAADRPGALALSGLLMGVVQMQKVQVKTLTDPRMGIPTVLASLVEKIYSDVEVGTEEAEVYYRIKKPADTAKLIEDMRPLLEEGFQTLKRGRDRMKKARKFTNLRQIGLAFHNYHDSYGELPASGENAKKSQEAEGLSWRVHLLPFLGHVKLHKKFDLEASWDSDTNKPLIDEMPEFYKSPGVEDATKTAFHVFLGEETPFGDGKEGIVFGEFTDGLSNTILVAQAGPDKAEVWTKPGGLEYTGDVSIKMFGKIGQSLVTLLADGSVHELSPDMDEVTLNRLIMHADGNSVDAF